MTREQIEARANALQEALVDIIDLIIYNEDNILDADQKMKLNDQINAMLYDKHGLILLRKPLIKKEEKTVRCF